MTLTELLVVIAIMVILMAVMVPALAAFTHTSRVVSAADTVAVMLRKTRDHALAKNVPTIPVILRDKKGRITMAYAARALTHTADGSLDGGNAPKTWGPAKGVGECSRWSLTRQSLDLPKLEQGAFVYLVGTPTLDLNHPNSGQAYNELVFMKVKRPPTHMLLNDSSKYTYQILMRGVHNTARGNFNLANTGRGTVDGYVVVGSEAGGNDVIQPDGSGVTISGVGVVLPDHITIDQVLNSKNEVCGTITAQAAIFREQSLTLAWGGKYEPPQFYPLFTPIFMPDGRVSAGFHNGASGAEVNRSFASRYVGQTLRVLDTITREARYIHVKAGGQVVVRTTLPGRYGDSETALAPGKGGVPVTDYKTVYPEPPPPPPPVVTPPPKPPIVIPPPPTTTSSSGSPGNPPPAKPPVTQPPTPPPPTPPTPPPPPSPTSTSSSGGRTSTSTSSNGGGGELDDGNWNWPWSR